MQRDCPGTERERIEREEKEFTTHLNANTFLNVVGQLTLFIIGCFYVPYEEGSHLSKRETKQVENLKLLMTFL